MRISTMASIGLAVVALTSACGPSQDPAPSTTATAQPHWLVDHTDTFSLVPDPDGSPTTRYAVYCVASTDYLPNASAAGRDVAIVTVEVEENVYRTASHGAPCPQGKDQ